MEGVLSSNCFIDLATTNQNEKSFTVTPIEINKNTDSNGFSSQIKSCDSIGAIWADITIQPYKLSSKNKFGEHGKIYWTKNLAHHIFKSISIEQMDEPIQILDGCTMDFLAHFNLKSGSKRKMYYKNIGNRDEIIKPHISHNKAKITLLFPFVTTKHPIATSTGFWKTIKYNTRKWNELMVLYNTKTGKKVVPTKQDMEIIPKIEIKLYGNHHIYGNKFRKSKYNYNKNEKNMIDTTFKSDIHTFKKLNLKTNFYRGFDFRSDKKIYGFLYGIRNTDSINEYSNYYENIINNTKIIYEETIRTCVDSNYSTYIAPFIHGKYVSDNTCMHFIPFRNGKIDDIQSKGYADFKKLANVTFGLDLNKNIQGELVIIPLCMTVLPSKSLI